jgi:CheY-like chemotaxis protein
VKNILVVDDDRTVLDVLTRALAGYRVWAARDPDEGLMMAGNLASLDLLITDFMMPSMMGDELIGRLRAKRPELKVLILTGHSELLDAENPPWWTSEPHLSKPVELQSVRAVVASLIGPPAEG